MKNAILTYFQDNFKSFYEKYLQDINVIGGDEYEALCPFHDDHKPSLNFNNKDGRYFCHGCKKKGDIFHFYGKTNNLDTRRDFAKILKGISRDFGIVQKEIKSRIVKIYDYTDSAGNLIFQVCRMDPKSFRQRRPDGKAGWIYNLKGIQPVLYNLPEIITAHDVIIVEGEKDVATLANTGFVATTAPMGARKWREEYNEVLKGKDIILIPDNDQEGREHMQQIAVSLNGTVKSFKWIDLPGVPSKGDVTDFVNQFNSKEEARKSLLILIEKASPYHPPKKRSLEDVVLTTSEFALLDIPDKTYYLMPWLKADSIVLITGYRGVGKTFFGLGIGDAITRGLPFGPWKCENPVPVLYVDGEMSQADIKERIIDLQLNTSRDNPFYLYSDHYANLLGLPRAHLGDESWRIKMKSILMTKKAKMLLLDNISSLSAGLDENKKQDWDPINQWLLELRFSGIGTIMLHHTNKEGGQRGTSAREDNLDISIMLKTPNDYVPEDGCRFICNFSKARVNTKDLPLISDTEFKLSNEGNKTIWTYKNVKAEMRLSVLKLFDDGMNNKDICAALNVSKGYVSKIKNKAITDGILTAKSKLTQQGWAKVLAGEI